VYVIQHHVPFFYPVLFMLREFMKHLRQLLPQMPMHPYPRRSKTTTVSQAKSGDYLYYLNSSAMTRTAIAPSMHLARRENISVFEAIDQCLAVHHRYDLNVLVAIC
jgi:hypothetical protein